MNRYVASRRHFLRSSSAIIALPLLESLPFLGATPTTVAGARPKRMIFLGIGFGVTRETWYPNVAQTGDKWDLTPGLKPLAQHQRDITLVQNLYHKFTSDAHYGSTFWLTGAPFPPIRWRPKY
jgi:Protein of unknown function (DUF1552)